MSVCEINFSESKRCAWLTESLEAVVLLLHPLRASAMCKMAEQQTSLCSVLTHFHVIWESHIMFCMKTLWATLLLNQEHHDTSEDSCQRDNKLTFAKATSAANPGNWGQLCNVKPVLRTKSTPCREP